MSVEGLRSRRLTRTRTECVYRRGNQYVLRIRDPRNGKEYKIAGGTVTALKTLRDAIRNDPVALDEALADRKRGRRIRSQAAATPLVREYVETWTATYKGRSRKGVRTETMTDYGRDLRKHIVSEIGDLRLDELTPQNIIDLVSRLENKRYRATDNKDAPLRQLTPGSIRTIFIPLRAMLATAVEDGLITSNPAIGVRLPAAVPKRNRPPGEGGTAVEDDLGDRSGAPALDDEQLAALIEAFPEHWRYIPILLARTGLRASELLGLKWRSVDLDGRRLSVVERRRRTGTAPPKTKNSRRTIPISDETVSMLSEIKEARGAQAGDYVALSTRGKPLSYGNFRRRHWVKATATAGVPWAGLHTMRHTCATNLLRKGTPLIQVSRWLGHADASFTANVYSHLSADDMPDPSLLD